MNEIILETPVMVKHYEELLLDNNQLFYPFQADGFSGWRPVKVRSGTPKLVWYGGKITIGEPSRHHPQGLWHEVAAFFRHCDTDEAQVRLFYAEDGDWRAWAFPQRGVGMSTNECSDHPDWNRQMEEIGPEYRYYGTIHSHCRCSAFQSGTDKHNEESQNGIHITIGYVDKPELDLHGRIYMHKQDYPVNWMEWFPPVELEIPNTQLVNYLIHKANTSRPEIMKEALMNVLKQAPTKDTVFPDKWKENMIRPTYNQDARFSRGLALSNGVHHFHRSVIVPDMDESLEITDAELDVICKVSELQTALDIHDHYADKLLQELAARDWGREHIQKVYENTGERFIAMVSNLAREHMKDNTYRLSFIVREFLDPNNRLVLDVAKPGESINLQLVSHLLKEETSQNQYNVD